MPQLVYYTQILQSIASTIILPTTTIFVNHNFVYDPSYFSDSGATHHIPADPFNSVVKIEFTGNEKL